MAYTVVFKDSSVTLSSQEQLDGCPIHQVPLAVHVPVNPEEIVKKFHVGMSTSLDACSLRRINFV